MEALNMGSSYVLDFVSQLWSCKTNLEQKTWLMEAEGYERGTRRGEGKEGRVESKERRATAERDGEDSARNKVFRFRFWLTATQNLEWKMWV